MPTFAAPAAGIGEGVGAGVLTDVGFEGDDEEDEEEEDGRCVLVVDAIAPVSSIAFSTPEEEPDEDKVELAAAAEGREAAATLEACASSFLFTSMLFCARAIRSFSAPVDA